ncbi:sulfur relay protein DsrC [Achromatium sp. WMS2]|nr:sulfur relay protein DsrC [Achromatium sp. WMS2]
MLKLSDILIEHKEVQSFTELTPLIQDIARHGERFFRIDIKPPYPDTPNDWEDRLEAAFSGLIR